MTRRKPTLRGNIFDLITLVLLAALVIQNTTGAAFRLIMTPARPDWAVALDWLLIAVFVAAVGVAVYIRRRMMKVVYQVEAQRRALHAKIRRGAL